MSAILTIAGAIDRVRRERFPSPSRYQWDLGGRHALRLVAVQLANDLGLPEPQWSEFIRASGFDGSQETLSREALAAMEGERVALVEPE